MRYPRSPHAQVGGLVYFGRMIDKIRLFATSQLHPDLHQNLGKGFDERCTSFLAVPYDTIKQHVLDEPNASEDALLVWCYEKGRRPSAEEIEIWNEFMRKRGWNDEATSTLVRRKKESGLEGRTDIQTMFDYIDADEGRPLAQGANG